MALEDRLGALRECGIALNPGRSVDEMLVSWDRKDLETDPHLVLVQLGGEVEAEPWGRRFCDALWHFDTECIEDHGAYARIAEHIRVLAGSDLPLAQVTDFVDIEQNQAWLSFNLDGSMVRWEAAVNHDWADPTILSRFAELIQKRGTGRRFTYLDLGGQDCVLGCASDAQFRALREVTGLKWQWLE